MEYNKLLERCRFLEFSGMKRGVITLLGVGQARVGVRFLHEGATSLCEGCKYSNVCLGNIEEGRVYVVEEVLENILPCPVHEGGVRAVRVVEADILTAIPVEVAVEGAVIRLKFRKCDELDCPNRNLCYPLGLKDGDKCKILELGEKVECREGSNLVKALVHRHI